MECGILILVIAILVGFAVIGYTPDLIVRGYRELSSSITDGGAFVGGCIAGSLSTLLLFLYEELIALGSCLFMAIIMIAGAISGAAVGAIWALLMDRSTQKGAKLGAVGGTVAAPISILVFLFLAMLFFGG